MKRIALISLHTPTATNCRGASALPYHLLHFRQAGTMVEVWSFNLNCCSLDQIAKSEQELGVKIHVVGKPRWFGLLSSAVVRVFLPKPMLAYLSLPDIIYSQIKSFLGRSDSALWIYGEDIAHLSELFKGVRTVVTTPDCEAMYYYRVLSMNGISKSKSALIRYNIMFHRYSLLAAMYPTGNDIIYHLVGKEDACFLNKLNPDARIVFIRHPHYDLSAGCHKDIDEDEKIKILIAGRYDFSMSSAVDEAIIAMLALPQAVKDRYKITFLGKGWERCCDIMNNGRFDAEHKSFVDNYAEEVSSHHIQLTPIAVGTGTKGKVLDAFANGLLVIGTSLALENIAVENGKECIEYSNGLELTDWLVKFAENPRQISEMAKAGKHAVLSNHGREKIADKFFNLFN